MSVVRIGKYMEADEWPSAMVQNGKRCWDIQNGKQNALLGQVLWYAPWKQYVFQPDEEAEFSADCLRDIAAFMEKANKA